MAPLALFTAAELGLLVQAYIIPEVLLSCSKDCFLLFPPQLDDCTLQLSHNGTYLDLESSLAEQKDELEGFQQDDSG